MGRAGWLGVIGQGWAGRKRVHGREWAVRLMGACQRIDREGEVRAAPCCVASRKVLFEDHFSAAG